MTTPENKWIYYELGDEYYKNMLPYSQEVYNIIMKHYRRSVSDSQIPFAIDIACGNGQISERLAKHCDKVLAFDISPDQIKVGKRNSQNPNVRYEVSSVYEMSQLLPENHPKADLMTCNASSHYFNNARFYAEVRKCLKIGGVLVEAIGNFEKFIECGDEMYEENLNYAKWLISDDQANDDYNQMYEIAASGFRSLNVLLENVTREESYIDIPVTITDAIKYFLCRQPNATELWEKAKIYYGNLWDKYASGSDKMTARFKIFAVFSQNLEPK